MVENFENRNQHEQNCDKWDVFEEPLEVLDDTPSEKKDKWTIVEKAAKLLSYIMAFLMVLGGSVISKVILFFMAAQLSNKPKPYCHEGLDTDQEFRVILPPEEKVAWMWALTFAYFIPQLSTFLRSFRILMFKSWNVPNIFEFLTVFLSESLTTIGNAILVFSVLPQLDSVKGCVLMSCLGLIPAVLSFSSNILDRSKSNKMQRPSRIVYFDLMSVIIQSVGLILLTLLQAEPIMWSLPVSAILISVGWWENYTSDKISRNIKIAATLTSAKKFPNSRYFSYCIVSLWKCGLFFGMMNLIEWNQRGKVDHLFSFTAAFSDHDIIIQNVSHAIRDVIIENHSLTPVWVVAIGITSTYFCYIFGKFACKISIQRVSYALPLHLSAPTTMVTLLLIHYAYVNNNCAYLNIIPSYLFFNLSSQYGLDDLWLLVIWLLLFLSYIVITFHIWHPEKDLLPPTERLYVRPFYEAFLIDQDLGMNRRRFDEPNLQKRDEENFAPNRGEVPKLYVCGTMWHETKEEMLTFLKSIMILDEDHCCRRIVRNYMNSSTTNYYELETHIVFDDAFRRASSSDQYPQINDFVKDLICSVDDAAFIVHKMDIKLKQPIKYSTPYGGKLEWVLPGKTKLVAHLKDNDKIRPKKRWSQVMYLYYILGHRIAERGDIDDAEKEIVYQNTYILAADGDIHFRPPAIHMLLQHMKRDKHLAAACGRIHPVGNGIFAWYQKFEYAISHWMYKASENITGCVLCCPGCFTMFRATAVMSILKKLTTTSTKAEHFIRFDHGEDRWISTLLVLCGYKVGYVASSDAYTKCPEGFRELYNQRRRWIPSTTANVLNLLSRTNTITKVNDNVSILYMIYQSIFNILTIIGPSMVLWIMVNICASLFHISHWLSLLLNIIPLLVYAAICAYVTNEKIQIQVALILCGIYTPIMSGFLIDGIFGIIVKGFLSPWSLFFCFFAIQLLLVGLIHPREICYIKYIIVYYIMTPTMHMLLFVYSVFNMHKVSWGTREVDKSISPDVSEKSWLEDNSLKYGNTRNLSDTENMFWSKLLDKYLHSFDNNKDKTKIMDDLNDLRNKVTSTLFILNIMFVSIIFMLTSKNITVKWPFGDTDEDEIEMELFNTVLIIGISSLFLVQIVAIFIHRFGTFSQVMSNTKLVSKKADIKADPVRIIRNLQKNHNGIRRRSTANGSWQASHAIEPKNHADTSDLEDRFLSNTTNNNVIRRNFNNGMPILNNDFIMGYANHGFTEDV